MSASVRASFPCEPLSTLAARVAVEVMRLDLTGRAPSRVLLHLGPQVITAPEVMDAVVYASGVAGALHVEPLVVQGGEGAQTPSLFVEWGGP